MEAPDGSGVLCCPVRSHSLCRPADAHLSGRPNLGLYLQRAPSLSAQGSQAGSPAHRPVRQQPAPLKAPLPKCPYTSPSSVGRLPGPGSLCLGWAEAECHEPLGAHLGFSAFTALSPLTHTHTLFSTSHLFTSLPPPKVLFLDFPTSEPKHTPPVWPQLFLSNQALCFTLCGS